MFLGLLRAYAGPLVLVVIAGALGSFAFYKGYHKRDSEVSNLRAQIVARDAEYARNIRTAEIAKSRIESGAAYDAAEAKRTKDSADATAAAQLSTALERVRRLQLARSATSAKPAADAPVECQHYDAAPELLPTGDQQLLERVGASISGIVSERNQCVAQYESFRRRLSAEVTAELGEP